MGLFTTSLYYKEQKQSLAELECGNCNRKGTFVENVQTRQSATSA